MTLAIKLQIVSVIFLSLLLVAPVFAASNQVISEVDPITQGTRIILSAFAGALDYSF